jgi:hypothetical protein
MNIHKSHIVELLRSRGHHDKAAEAEAELPEDVDVDEHQLALKRWGVSTHDAVGASKLGPGRMGL